MRCPVCPDQTLVMSERQGVEIDYCPKCRGVWLDRGELDKIIAAAAQHENAAAPTPVPAPAAQATQAYQGYQNFQQTQQPLPHPQQYPQQQPQQARPQPYQGKPAFADSDYDEHHSRQTGYKRKSWLSDLFD